MADIKAGKINCIVVKDLSRFGRDHLEAGTYIEKIFPVLGVRFIAINDHYDSLHRNPESDELIVPFKNLVNEAYCRDISIKTRSHLDIKRRNGDFIGAFPMYGYRKDPEDHNRLLIDEEAASVVQDIFQWKLDGISTQDIADRLNAAGVPTPMDYKTSQGMRYQTKFRKKSRLRLVCQDNPADIKKSYLHRDTGAGACDDPNLSGQTSGQPSTVRVGYRGE